MKFIIKYNQFWAIYLGIRIFYLLFTILVYSRLSTLGDSGYYMTTGLHFSWDTLINSTSFMSSIGGFFGYFLGGINVLSNLPFTLYSFWIVRWAIRKLELREYVPSYLLLILISLPNFCIWTSVCAKELAGLTFSAVYAVLIINFLKGDYKIRGRDILATYLCLMFKPQYFPFILQGLLYIYFAGKWCRSQRSKMILGLVFVGTNCLFLYLIREIINQYAGMMYVHFDMEMAKSTRENIFLADGDFFRYLPWGMFISFWGPTLGEMVEKPLHLIAGTESLIILSLFLILAGKFVARFLLLGKVNVTLFFSYFIIITGICFIHYPFGIFNPGSAIRYRTNFLFLFVVLLMYLYVCFKIQKRDKQI